MRRWLNLPNSLTLLRLGMIPFIVRAILTGAYRQALVLFLIAAITDSVDGALARRFGAITSAGAYLDPIADKLLLSSTYLAMAIAATVPWWFVGVVFTRDFLILAGSGAALCFTHLRRFSPSVWGKASTFLQIVTAVTWMVRNAAPSPVLNSIATGLLWPATAITVWSGVDYLWRGAQKAWIDERGAGE